MRKRKRKTSSSKRKFSLSPVAKARIGIGLLAVMLAGGLYFLHDLPDIDKVKPLNTKPSITILSSDGTLVARYGGMHGQQLGIRDFPDHLVQAVLSVEDRRFYSHFGIDPFGLARAMVTNLRHGRFAQGGSTITQQLAKNLFLTPDKTIRRKVQEALMALQIERRYTKNQILSAYLNRVYFGAGAYGVDAAARTYFNKPVSQLNLWESATLAGVLKAPSRFSPSANPELSRKRSSVVLEAMKDAGYIDARTQMQEITRAQTRAPAISAAGDYNRYFADWVIDQIDAFIGTADTDIIVRTTLDMRLQQMAEEKQKALFARIPETDKVTQIAILTLTPDGAIMAMIGGRDYRQSQFNRATQAWRQPGSVFKTFVFLAALEAGMDPRDKIEDAPITEGDYRPSNYNNKYFGEVTLTDALAKSMNTATVRLLSKVGVSRLAEVATRLGISDPVRHELASGLGADEVTLMDLTASYAVIAGGGRAVWPYAVLDITDGHGQTLYQRGSIERPRVFARGTMRDIDRMLEQVIDNGTGGNARLSRGHVAGKTGTTQNYRDAWFVGYTNELVTGIWMGNDNATPMENVTGGKYPAQLWRDYMEGSLGLDLPVFEKDSGQDGGFFGLLERWSSDNKTGNRHKTTYEYNR